MTPTDVMNDIMALADGADDPALTTAQQAAILRRSARADTAGRPPADSAWVPTYNIAAGVALAWQLKAGNAAGSADYNTLTQNHKDSQIYDHCMKMAKEWKKRANSTIPVYPRRQTAPVDYYNNVDLVR